MIPLLPSPQFLGLWLDLSVQINSEDYVLVRPITVFSFFLANLQVPGQSIHLIIKNGEMGHICEYFDTR